MSHAPLLPLGGDLAKELLDRIRVSGGVAARFERHGLTTRGLSLREADGYRLRFPDRALACEAVVMNTGGGVAGGDVVAIDMTLGAAAHAIASSVGAERIYRSIGAESRINLTITLEDQAQFLWIPHETILFDGARMSRTIICTLPASAHLTLVDLLVMGRRGMGEVMRSGSIDDQWRIRRDGKLIHAEAMRLEGDIEARLGHPACAASAPVIATIIHCAPDCEARLPSVRTVLDAHPGITIAASAWDRKLVIRALGDALAPVRAALAAILPPLTGRSAPRGWADHM